MGKCDMQKLYTYNSCILSYHLFYFLNYFFSKYYAKFQPQGSYNLGSFMRVSTVHPA